MSKSSVCPINRTLSGAITLGHSGPRSDVNKRVLCVSQSSSITRASPSDCLVLYTGHSGESFSTAQPAWPSGTLAVRLFTVLALPIDYPCKYWIGVFRVAWFRKWTKKSVLLVSFYFFDQQVITKIPWVTIVPYSCYLWLFLASASESLGTVCNIHQVVTNQPTNCTWYQLDTSSIISMGMNSLPYYIVSLRSYTSFTCEGIILNKKSFNF